MDKNDLILTEQEGQDEIDNFFKHLLSDSKEPYSCEKHVANRASLKTAKACF